MKPMNTREVVRELENAGFCLIRTTGHYVYKKGNATAIVSRSKTTSPGVYRKIVKTINEAR